MIDVRHGSRYTITYRQGKITDKKIQIVEISKSDITKHILVPMCFQKLFIKPTYFLKTTAKF